MMTGAKAKATVAYCTPMATTASSLVNRRRKAGMAGMLTARMTTPCNSAKAMPWVAAVSALACSPAPLYRAMRALMPTPKPMAMALIEISSIWIGNTYVTAASACSLIIDTKKLSTML